MLFFLIKNNLLHSIAINFGREFIYLIKPHEIKIDLQAHDITLSQLAIHISYLFDPAAI